MIDHCIACSKDGCQKVPVVTIRFELPNEPDDPMHFHSCEDHEYEIRNFEDSMRLKFPDMIVEWTRE